MHSNFTISFRVSSKQNIVKGSIVTYVDEFRLSSIREHLSLKTDFFVVSDTDGQNIDITNGLDNIKSTDDQLIQVVPYLDEIPTNIKPSVGGDPNRYLRDLMKWKQEDELLRSYPIRDNYLSIIACGLVITDLDFQLETSNMESKDGKRKIFASLIPDKISLYLEG